MPLRTTETIVDDSTATTSDGQPSESTLSSGAVKFEKFSPWIAGLLIVLYVLQLGIHLNRTSVTYDEKVFILAGHRYWECGNYTINPGHPPLPKLVAALPLRSKSLIDSPPCETAVTTIYDGYIQADHFLIANGIDPVVIPARWAEVSFSILLALLLFFGIRRMFGWQEALVALALLAFEPVLIAHGSLATTDMAIASTFFLSVLAFYLFCQKPTLARLLGLGLSIGATFSSKHTSLAAISLLWLVLRADLWATGAKWSPETKTRLRRCAGGLAAAIIIGWVCLWGAYGFRYYALHDAHAETLPFKFQPPALTGAGAKLEPVVDWMRRAHIFPEAYLFGLRDILHENTSNAMYFFGQKYATGAWFYFPTAFAIKTSLPLLILLCLGLFLPSLYRKRKREMAFLLIPALGYLAFAMASGLAIGIRHILPVYPFAIGIAAAGGCELARRFPKGWMAIAAVLAFGAVDSARTLPNDMAFSNELWGGTNNTYKFLSDSNVDWGQNLKQIRTYIETHHVGQCWIAANGTPEIARAILPCHLLPAPFQWFDHPIDDVPAVIEGIVFLSNEALPAEFPDAYEKIVQNKPVDLIGGATFVYNGRFDVTEAALKVHSGNSAYFYSHGQLPPAIDELRQSIALQPDDARLHFVMGKYLLVEKQTAAARDEFTRCIALATQNGSRQSDLQALAEREIQAIP